MIELIKKAALTGIGVASMTTEKIEEFSKEFAVKGKMSEQEGQKFVEEMLKRAEESREALKVQTETFVNGALAKVNLARAQDMEELRSEIEKLRQDIDQMRGELKKSASEQ